MAVDLEAVLANIVERAKSRTQAAVLDIAATVRDLLDVPGATEEGVYRALADATGPIGGQVEGSLTRALRTTINAGADRELSAIQREYYDDYGLGGGGWTWVSVLDDRTCDAGIGPGGCSQRHGLTFTDEQLGEVGEPGAGGTACRWNCRCVVVPAPVAAPDGDLLDSLKDPIVRPRRKR